MRTRVLSYTFHLLSFAAVGAAMLLASCGAITEDDLQKWSRNEEGLSRITEMMKDDEVPFDIRVRAIDVLVQNGWANRVKKIVEEYENPTELADAVSEQFTKGLKSELAQATLARDGLYALMGLLSEKQLEKVQGDLVKWIFGGIDVSMDRAKIWDEVVGPRIGNLNQIKDLGKQAVDSALILLEKRVEIETFPMIAMVDWFLEFNDPAIKQKAWDAVKRQYQAAFAQMRKDKKIEMKLMEELTVLHHFQTAEAVMFVGEFIDLVKTVDPDPAKEDILLRYNLILNMQTMLEEVVPKEERAKYIDVVLGHLINVLPLIPDYTGETRHANAVQILKATGIPGLDAIPLTTTTVDANGKEQKAWKLYLERWEKDPKTGKIKSIYSPTDFIFGVTRDYLDQLASKEHQKLMEEFEAKWAKQAEADAAQAAAKAAQEAADKAAAEAAEAAKKAEAGQPAEAPKPAEEPKAAVAPAEPPKPVKPNFEADPAFRAELLVRLDKTVTPVVEGWLKSPVKLARVFAVAGLRYLATQRAVEILTREKIEKMDLAMYFGAGVTLGVLAENALKAVEYSREFDELQRANLEKEVILPAELQDIRNAMQADLLLPPAKLTEKYSKLLEERKAKYTKAREELLNSGKVYAKSLRRLCINSVKDYPPLTDTAKLERRVKEMAQACYQEAYDKTKPTKAEAKHPLEYFELDQTFCEAAVKIGINQKEVVRKARIKAMVRAWLGGVVENTFFPTDSKAKNTLADVLRTAKLWSVADPKIAPVIANVKGQTFQYLRSPEYAKSNTDPSQLLSQDDLNEYERELESPDMYVLAKIMAFYFKLDYKELQAQADPKAPAAFATFNLFKDAARNQFGRDAFFKNNPEVTAFLIENAQDAYYILMDMGSGMADEQVMKYWGLKQEELDKYKTLVAAMNASIDQVYAEAEKTQSIPAPAMEAMKKNYPAYSTVLELAFETIRTLAIEAADAAAKAEEAKKATAPAAAPAEKPADAAPAAPTAPAEKPADAAPAAQPAAQPAQ